MELQTEDFLQADRLIQVGEVARAVAAGKVTDDEIESYIGLDSEGRQGRYYRHAAGNLGLIVNEKNHASLTPVGVEFSVLSSKSARLEFLARCLTEAPVFKEALQYIASIGPTDQQIKLWHRSIYPGSPKTADRRLSTLLSYFRDTKLLDKSGKANFLTKHLGTVEKIELPEAFPLSGTAPPMAAPIFVNAAATLTIDKNSQKLERASTIHWQLIDAKSTYLVNKGIAPKSNAHIDLFGTQGERILIYEMKSINEQGSNLLSQVRRGVAQLYEYRYIYGQFDAALSIVTNSGLSKSQQWLSSYLAKDRGIAYEWTSDFKQFSSDKASSALLDSVGF